MKVTVATIQCSLTDSREENVSKITSYVRKSKEQGANIVLPSELFEGLYFCREEKDIFFARAHAVTDHPTIQHFQKLAKELSLVIPVSFFEQSGPHYFNSIAMIDADGTNLGIYRKSHIPDGPGYEEKFYFNPGNTGFRTWATQYGSIGVGICWDQWFPECARAMVLQGADLLLYPTAIGSEPNSNDWLLTKDRWQRAMIGHAVSNVVPVIAANRIGKEGDQSFYGHSFIANEEGSKVGELPAEKEGLLTAVFDLEKIKIERAGWGFFRDRRPELYKSLTE